MRIPTVNSGFVRSERVRAEAKAVDIDPYTSQFIDFIYDNPTVFHASEYFAQLFTKHGFTYLSERVSWAEKIERGGKYFTTRNGSSLVAFVIGNNYKAGEGVGMIGAHIDALTAKIKPISKKPVVEGYTQIGAAPYAGTMTKTWWDRDLGIGGRVLIKTKNGVIKTKLVQIPYPIARIPTLAPHFGAPANGPFNLETNTTPIIALEDGSKENELLPEEVGAPLVDKHNIRLLRVIANELDVDVKDLLSFDLELYDTQKGVIGGLQKEFLFCPRIDDKLCAFAAVHGLLNSADSYASTGKGLNVVALFDNEEIGSLLKQGAKGGLLEGAVARVIDSLGNGTTIQQTFANSFLVSADVCHAVNPNFIDQYLQYHNPHLNVGITLSFEANGSMTTDAESAALLEEIARRTGNTLQYTQGRNGPPSGGTIGPMLSSSMGCRAADVGIPQLSMHSIRATTGSKDVGLGVKMFQAFYERWEEVDSEFKRGSKTSYAV
ncbi:peptidase M18 [Lipomyces japonicus]|uniref:peptidase M18 n=1 Tax=Lipomyces japonicus TaxID=56871 RepID=UPI0034CF20CA